MQVAELFEVESSPGEEDSTPILQPATKRELLSAMLTALRDSHWCRAVGCQAEPALMKPISPQAAASGAVAPMQGYDIERALAAAERRLVLLPSSR